jgi:hypothetical protein
VKIAYKKVDLKKANIQKAEIEPIFDVLLTMK